MNSDLERKIQEALDAGRDLADVPDLATALEHAEVAEEARELAEVDALVRGWALGGEDVSFDALAARIEQRLDESLAPLAHDPTLPPGFEDDDSWRVVEDESEVGHSGEFALSALADQMETASPAAIAAAPSPSPSPPSPSPPAQQSQSEVVHLADRSSNKMPWVLAAAAVIGLVATGAMMSFDNAPEAVAMMQESVTLDGPDLESAVAPPSAAANGQPEAAELAPTESESRAPAPSATGRAGAAEAAPLHAPQDIEAELAVEVDDQASDERLEGGLRGPARRRRRTVRTSHPATSAQPMQLAMEAPRMASRRIGGAPGGDEDAERARVVRSTRAAVYRCLDDPPDPLDLRVEVEGATGRVRDVIPLARFSPAQVSCLRAALRRARFAEREDTLVFRTHLRYSNP